MRSPGRKDFPLLLLMESPMSEWKRGLPPGKYYEGMVDDYEVAFAPLAKWYRKRTPEERAAHIEARERNLSLKTAQGKPK